MNMHIVAAVVVIMASAPCAHSAGAPCNLPSNLGSSGWKIIGGAENDNTAAACVPGALLQPDATCWVMPEAGYTSNAATATATSYTCTSSTLNVVDLKVTGCKDNYRMSDGSTETDIVCTACEPGKMIATMPFSSGVQTCSDCDGASAGSCAMGCGLNFYQSSGTTSSDIKCTACNPGTSSLSKPVQNNTSDVCSACDGSVSGDCSTGCAADFYQSVANASEIICTACSLGTNIAAMTVQSNVTSCAVTSTTTTTTTMTNMQACAVPSNATNPAMIVAYLECLGSQCEDASTPWLEGLLTTTARRLASAPTTTTTPVPMVTCTYLVAVIQSNCSMMVGSALGLLMTDMNKSLDADVAQAVEQFTVNSLCSSACDNKCSDGASNPSGTTGGSSGGSALVNAAPITGPFIPFLTLAPTALLLSMCL